MSSPKNDNKDNAAAQDTSGVAVAAIHPTTVDEDNSAGGGVGILVPETKSTMMMLMLIYWLTR
jgi:hypothetical protein